MKFRSNPQQLERQKQVENYLRDQPDGEDLSWERIEADTHISMATDGDGRDLVRLALYRLRRPYEAVRGKGVRLSCPDSAMAIAHEKLIRIDGAVRTADRTQQQLQTRHLAQMRGPEQQKLLMLASFFGAIRTIAKNATSRVFKSVE